MTFSTGTPATKKHDRIDAGEVFTSVIVPVHNGEQTIEACIRALLRQSVPLDQYEILVVDDGSTDRTRDIVSRTAGVRLISQANAGPAAARNHGAREASGHVLLFTDADCAPDERWVERMTAPFRERPEIGGVKGAYLSEQNSLVARFVQLEYEDKYRRMSGYEYIDFIDTYSAGYRRDVFLAAGGFDTTFPNASVEDQEFSFRLARQGHKMIFVRDACVRHLGHADSLRRYVRKKYNIGRWKVLVHKRHPDKMLTDTHTPQILKLQIILAASMALLGLAGSLWPPARLVAWGTVATFALTTWPFVLQAWRKDVAVALSAPFILFLRAWALGLGLAAGLLLHHARDRSDLC